MTNNSNHDGEFDAEGNARAPFVQAQLIRQGSPEHRCFGWEAGVPDRLWGIGECLTRVSHEAGI